MRQTVFSCRSSRGATLSMLCVALSCLALLPPGSCSPEVSSREPTNSTVSAVTNTYPSGQSSNTSDPRPSSPSSDLSTSTSGRSLSFNSTTPSTTRRRHNTTNRIISTSTSARPHPRPNPCPKPDPGNDCLVHRKHRSMVLMVTGAAVVLCTVLLVVSMVLSCQVCHLRQQVRESQGHGGRVVRSNVDLVNSCTLGGTARRKELASETSLLMTEVNNTHKVSLSLEGAEEEDQENHNQENQEKSRKKEENQEKEEKGGDEASRQEKPGGSEKNSTSPPASQDETMTTATPATPDIVVA